MDQTGLWVACSLEQDRGFMGRTDFMGTWITGLTRGMAIMGRCRNMELGNSIISRAMKLAMGMEMLARLATVQKASMRCQGSMAAVVAAGHIGNVWKKSKKRAPSYGKAPSLRC
jgi:hypothetical protein